MNKMQTIAVGIDVGTTTVSGIVLDSQRKKVLQIYNVANDSKIPSDVLGESIQSPNRILEIVWKFLNDILEKYPVTSIGVTGQMHGILLISPEAEALSPLYTWQDMQASLGEDSTCDKITQSTGYRVPAGYGLATLYHLILNNKVPKKPYFVGTIMDYITMKLTGIQRPVMHITNAASWGFFDPCCNNFDTESLEKLGICEEILPSVTADKTVVGEFQKIPVAVAIGDNQAAFMGSASDAKQSVLVNIGTGSQVSLLSKESPLEETLLIEARPFDGEQFLYSGSCLCGGRSYALLEKFFRQFAVKCGLEDKSYYDVLNSLAEDGIKNKKVAEIFATFAGTRENPNLRGKITNIGEDNFTPEAFSAGMLYGMANELFSLYQKMPNKQVTKLIASGNGVRKNPVLRQVLEDVFEMKLVIPEHTEEAAFGAAMFGYEAK